MHSGPDSTRTGIISAPTRRAIVTNLLALPLAACGKDSETGAYPQKNITFIIPYGVGGGFDLIVRVIAPAMEKYLPNGRHIIPLNIAAGGGGKGITQIYRSAPDGYTIGIVSIPGAFIHQQKQQAGFDLNKFTWLGKVGRTDHYGIAVAWNSPFRTIEDLIRASRKKPIKFPSSGPDGTSYSATVIGTHILGMRSDVITGYKGSSDFLVATIRGDGDAVVASTSNLLPLAKSKHLRMLATFEAEASVPGVPDATAIGYPELARLTVERMVCGPPALPKDIVDALSSALNKTADDAQAQALASKLYAPLSRDTPEHAATIVREQGEMFEAWKRYL